MYVVDPSCHSVIGSTSEAPSPGDDSLEPLSLLSSREAVAKLSAMWVQSPTHAC